MTYNILLENGTTGTLECENIEQYLGCYVTVMSHDENGMEIETTGILSEIFD
jgi:hypothetical protein